MTRPSTDTAWTQLSADLRRFIRRRVSDEHTADDLLQETFLRIHRNVENLAEAERLAAWVYQIARNVIHDHYRRAPENVVALAEVDPAAAAEDRRACLCGGSEKWLDEMIRQLPEKYRDAVRLAELEGLPQQEVAARMGLSLPGAKSRIQRGRAMLKNVLDQCCAFEFDRRGNVVDYNPRPNRTVCHDCGEEPPGP